MLRILPATCFNKITMEAPKRHPKINRHHTKFPRPAHESNDNELSLRQDPSLIVRMHVDPHAALHKHVSMVPLMEYNMSGRVRRAYEGDIDDPLHSIDLYMKAVEDACKHPKANELDRRIGELIIYAMDMQRPFIQEGIYRATLIDLGRLANRGYRAA